MRKMVAIKVPRSMHGKNKLLKHPPKITKNVTNDVIEGKLGRIYIPNQEIEKIGLTSAVKGLKQERGDDAKEKKKHSKKQKVNTE